MANIHYVHDTSIFTCNTKSVLAQTCNCSGMSNTGIAIQFALRFPHAHQRYLRACRDHSANPDRLLGTCLLTYDQGYWVACLFTSVGFSPIQHPRISHPNVVLSATRTSIVDLLRQLHRDPYLGTLRPGDEYFPTINMHQINSDVFNVPWSDTEAVISEIPFKFNVFIEN